MNTITRHVFKSSPFYGGHFLKGDTIEINSETITLQRGYYFNKFHYSISMPITNVVYIEINNHKLGAEILIQSFSSNYIMSKGYSISSARKIKQLIQQ